MKKTGLLATIVGLTLGTVAVVAIVVLVTTTKSSSDHQAFCQRYKDTLTLAYTDNPSSVLSTAGLSAKDAASVTRDEQTYRQAYAQATAPTVPVAFSGDLSTAFRNAPPAIEDPQTLQADFESFVQQAIPKIMAEHSC